MNNLTNTGLGIEYVKSSIERLLNDKVQIELLYKILKNIQQYPDESKYKTIKASKLNEYTRDVLRQMGFKYRVKDFQEILILDSNQYKLEIDMYVDVIEKRQSYMQQQKECQKTVIQQIKQDKEKQVKTHEELMYERLHRKKYNGWLT